MSQALDFESLLTLRKYLEVHNNQLQVLHPGKIWTASFEWVEPADSKQINAMKSELINRLPADYIRFLTGFSNGAVLYYDPKYGQWGYKIYGLSDLAEMQLSWRETFQDNWTQDHLALGEIIGEPHALVINLSKINDRAISYGFWDANPMDTPSEWEFMASSLETWLENLITAQGAKYWLWK